MTTHYTILLDYDEEGPGYIVSVPALPGCFTQGSTVPEAIERAKEAIAGYIEALMAMGEDVPTEEFPTLLTVVEVESLASKAS